LFYALILEFLIEAVEKLKSLSKSVRSQGWDQTWDLLNVKKNTYHSTVMFRKKGGDISVKTNFVYSNS
jgi:hypothetical protein